MKNPLPAITSAVAESLKDPKVSAVAAAGFRDLVLIYKLRNAAKAGNTARAVFIGTMLVTSSISDAQRRLVVALEPPKPENPFADVIRAAAAHQARAGR